LFEIIDWVQQSTNLPSATCANQKPRIWVRKEIPSMMSSLLFLG